MIYKVNDNEHFHLELLINISEKDESIFFVVNLANKITSKKWKRWYNDDQFSQALAEYRKYEEMFFLTKDTCTDPRRFFVKTPAGLLRVQAKADNDDPSDYPGVYIDLVYPVYESLEDQLLACVEYDSCSDHLQTCTYQPGREDPSAITIHEFPKEESE